MFYRKRVEIKADAKVLQGFAVDFGLVTDLVISLCLILAVGIGSNGL